MSTLPVVQLRRRQEFWQKSQETAKELRKNYGEKRIRLIQNARGAVSAKLHTIYYA